VLNEMVLVLVIDAVDSSTSTKIPVNMRNGTPTRVPATCGLFLAWQFTTHRQQSYLLVTEDDFAKAAGVAKVMVEG
jgi:hypothetical protein